MGQDQVRQLLHQGINAARQGHNDTARPILQQVVRMDPGNEIAWMWLSSVAVDDNERLFCLKKLLEINPQHEFAIKGLRALGVEPTRPADLAGSTTIPRLDEAKYSRVIQAADEFLLRYNPHPLDRVNIQWTHKRRGRYGERGAQRLRQLAMASMLLVVAAVVAVVIAGISQTGLLRSEGQEVARVNTRIPSLTPKPTLTPTVGGPTPTEFPDLVVPPTSIPSGLVKGDPYALAVPTAIYPRVNTNVARLVREAVALLNIGEVAQAHDMFQKERERSDPHCYPMLVYFEARSLVTLGKYQDAEELLNWAANYEPPRGYSTCRGAAILDVGLAEVAYAQDHRSQRALELATRALEQDAGLIPAVSIKARVELAQGQYVAARGTISRALVAQPDDLNLLLLAAQIELADGQPIKALDYLGQVLYMEPAQLEALHLQAETYLALAAQSPAGTEAQKQYYGLAVRSAQTLQLYYPGDPAGYFYLGQARLGEGQLEEAETALTQIIQVAEALDDSFEETLKAAYRLRGEIRYEQGRFASAQDDFKQAVFGVDGNLDVAVAEKLVDIAERLHEYSDAESWLEQLMAVDPSQPDYQLRLAQFQVETCALYQYKPRCDFEEAMTRLSDKFIATLDSDEKRAAALSYRAQAQYWIVHEERSSGEEGADLPLQLALNDINQALVNRNAVVDHYYRGLILEALGKPLDAAEAYDWVLLWGTLYRYPFETDAFVERVENVKAQAVAYLLELSSEEEEPEEVPGLGEDEGVTEVAGEATPVPSSIVPSADIP